MNQSHFFYKISSKCFIVPNQQFCSITTSLYYKDSFTSAIRSTRTSLTRKIQKESILLENESKLFNTTDNVKHGAERKDNSIPYTPDQLLMINEISNPKRNKRTRHTENKSKVFEAKKEELKKEVEAYQQFYKKDLMDYTNSSEKHRFMVKNFPGSFFKIENFYVDIMKKKRAKKKLDPAKSCPKIPKASAYTKKKERNAGSIKKWDRGGGKLIESQVNSYLSNAIKVWPHEEISWSEEHALGFLMLNCHQIEKTIKLIKNCDPTFTNFIMDSTVPPGKM